MASARCLILKSGNRLSVGSCEGVALKELRATRYFLLCKVLILDSSQMIFSNHKLLFVVEKIRGYVSNELEKGDHYLVIGSGITLEYVLSKLLLDTLNRKGLTRTSLSVSKYGAATSFETEVHERVDDGLVNHFVVVIRTEGMVNIVRLFLKLGLLSHIDLRLEEVEVFVLGMGDIKQLLTNLMLQKRSCSNADANISSFSDPHLNFLRVILFLLLKPIFKLLDVFFEVVAAGHHSCILLLIQGHLRKLVTFHRLHSLFLRGLLNFFLNLHLLILVL